LGDAAITGQHADHGEPGTRPSWPGQGGEDTDCLRVTLAGLPESVSQARRLVRPVLAAWAAAGDEADSASLLVTELVTNAVRFSPGPVILALWRPPRLLVVEVSDRSPDLPLPRQAGPDAENGRGMLLVRELSLEWGCYVPRPGWKTVYCSIAVSRESAATRPLLDSPRLQASQRWPSTDERPNDHNVQRTVACP
jgi:anti-sigma regulatory factor (Ser/Thr protein kinase)